MAEKKQDDAGQAEVQARFTDAQEKGHFGEKPEGIPNEAYTLRSGPDSPSPLEARAAAAERLAKDIRASAGDNKSKGA